MNTQRLSEEQLYSMNYIHSTYDPLPAHSRDVSKLKIPFVVSLTPFPRNIQPPTTLPYCFQNAAVCKQCSSLASNRYSRCQDGVSWICQACSHKNAFSEKYPPIDNSPQSKVSIFDTLYPKNPSEVTKINPPFYKPDFFFLVIERSDATIKNGLFKAVLDKIREMIVSKQNGKFSIFFYDTYFHFPMIVGDRKSFSVSTLFDVEEAILPPAEVCFFQLETDRNLVYKYIEYLETAPQNQLMVKLNHVIKTVGRFASRARIPVVFLTSQSEVGTKTQLHELGLSLLKNAPPLKFLCLTPVMAPPDFAPLSELTQILNAKVQVFSQAQINYLPTDLLSTLTEPSFVDVIVYCTVSPCLKIVDMKGNGIKRTEQSFSIPYLSLNDTLYFAVDYSTPQIDVPAPAFQCQVRFIDSKRRKFIRTISKSFFVSDHMQTIVSKCDFDIYIASAFVRCADKVREIGKKEAAIEELDKIKNEFIGDKFSRMFFCNLPVLTRSKIENALAVGRNFLDPIYFPEIIGKNPFDVSLFFAPEAFLFDLTSTQMQGPFTLSGVNIPTGAMYVRLNNSRGLVILAENQNIAQWVEEIGHPPVSKLIASVCKENVIEIVAPSISAEHNLYKHVLTCIKTPLKK